MRDNQRGAEVTMPSILYALEYRNCVLYMWTPYEDDTTENKKYISTVLDLFSIPNFFMRKGRPHGHRYEKAPGCKEYHTANQLARNAAKRSMTASTTDSSATRPSGRR